MSVVRCKAACIDWVLKGDGLKSLIWVSGVFVTSSEIGLLDHKYTILVLPALKGFHLVKNYNAYDYCHLTCQTFKMTGLFLPSLILSILSYNQFTNDDSSFFPIHTISYKAASHLNKQIINYQTGISKHLIRHHTGQKCKNKFQFIDSNSSF